MRCTAKRIYPIHYFFNRKIQDVKICMRSYTTKVLQSLETNKKLFNTSYKNFNLLYPDQEINIADEIYNYVLKMQGREENKSKQAHML